MTNLDYSEHRYAIITPDGKGKYTLTYDLDGKEWRHPSAWESVEPIEEYINRFTKETSTSFYKLIRDSPEGRIYRRNRLPSIYL
ncbi:hypothetical protein VF04_04225 [Nostoc linckia z7]|uniref:Uncharacterized protein n=2 Tax=Nostoc linckia TaxID=92942 RepID=A0A9Q6ENG7_NOSLI|nr:hypothetical protein [Nostoc linckia]PHK42920.1 hypothetical protein VF12_00925 [Nostoc linckia z15]PHK48077.1 hypothetical protein VF13_01900 [Nostoc linckia z16]PHJ64997.1 hypothetical protein VF02_11710 [Nostoc linckia z1]PHJ70175.1 hypothetical protein VF05_11870 [Nostoc linckia z3]PHJ75076.1 hypothetical protein VF03_12030 [Nostoc linckia z2]